MHQQCTGIGEMALVLEPGADDTATATAIATAPDSYAVLQLIFGFSIV